MTNESLAELKAKFLRAYANLPEPERTQVIVIIDKPYSWDVAYAEISKDTELGKKILEKLTQVKIL